MDILGMKKELNGIGNWIGSTNGWAMFIRKMEYSIYSQLKWELGIGHWKNKIIIKFSFEIGCPFGGLKTGQKSNPLFGKGPIILFC
jgi:hypothetical protein